MAKLTATQKKNRNKFIALLIAIVLVCAAIAFILFDGITSKSALFENQDFARGLASALDKLAINLDSGDIENARYLDIQYNAQNNEYSINIGYDDFDTEYEKQAAEAEKAQAEAEKAQEEKTDAENSENAENTENTKTTDTVADETQEKTESIDLSTLLKSATFVSKKAIPENDIKKFTGVKTLSISGITLSDVSFVENLTGLTKGYFNSCGISDVSPFAKLNLENIKELDFTGNEISDWSALESISDKVLVQNTYTIEATEDGQYQLVPIRQTLTQYLEEQAKAQEENAENAENAENTENAENAENTENAQAAE